MVLQSKKKKMEASPSMDTPNAHNAELICSPTQNKRDHRNWSQVKKGGNLTV